MSMSENASTSGEMAQTAPVSEERSQGSESSTASSSRKQTEKLTETQQVDAIAEMLAGNSQQSNGEPQDDAGPDDDGLDAGDNSGGSDDVVEQPVEFTPQALAEQLDIDVSEVYNLKVAVGDDQITLGKLKDAYAERESFAAEIAEKGETVRDREAGLVTDIQTLGVLEAMQQLPANLRDQANNHLQAMAQREYGNFLTLYPEYREDANRIAFEKDMTEWMADYGLTPGQFPIRTLGMYQLIRDALHERKKSKAAKKPPMSAKSKRSKGKAVKPKPRVGSKDIQGQTNAIEQLLKGR